MTGIISSSLSLGSNGMNIVTPRLRLRPLSLDDKHWILTLNRDPLWLKFIGCKSIFTLQDACDYIARTNAQRDEWGYGLCAVECQSTGNPLGVCGLFNRFSFCECSCEFYININEQCSFDSTKSILCSINGGTYGIVVF